MKNREQVISFMGVIVLALVLPGILKLANGVVRYLVGAEGRLSAIAIETDHPLGPLPAVWRGLAQGGEDLPTFLNGNEQKVAELKPQYIRIDHILDQFGVVNRNSSGLTFDWSQLDRVVRQIISTKATPFFSLSYMPAAISSGDTVAPPKDWKEWSLVVQKTIEHFSGEMGLSDVYYEVWNEPDLFGEWKMSGKKDYRTLYLYSVRGAEQAAGVKPFKIGGPATTGLYKSWVDNFFPFILKNNLRMDFYSWHRYDADINKYTADVEDVDRWIEGHPYFSNVEKIVSELGPDNEKGGANDTMVGAAHLAAVSRELMFKVKYGMSFAVTGSWGILDKPRSEALKVLSRLGSDRLAVTGEGTWVRAIGALDGDTYQVLLVNYDPKGAHSEIVPVSFINLKQGNFILKRTVMGASTVSSAAATSEAILQREIPMAPNSIVLLELEPVNNPQTPASNPTD
ncbi:hypothetical protein A2701_01590 [Candidatus Amesbacteria bacterium RIFCSPHIGHO2_01_FULL_47_34]|uniref:Glycosyl hydrolases family 39 N-terminal catalytic domain-containing protein n=5 Tax=Candidatus Amesiibacteriota TaxID=1752730 RepID=A0A1F4ZU34_9BACT|nr:MAG: hypothetical protein A2701_01590 [Candidatus Amesbacteria bacterium RIFCSPHIGHO2_01_FULL_47_34]OGD01923.1 MAG: hypothetical protein A2972_02220 [Candidatus Amesbacteria bacterium RIFCSPLOWO2_01_FULL_47_33]OGD09628.1 MAG: hypothetical protein A2395_04330 [Candidatus Amesbacteria bacterium RIFOXYB1_FULL_47_9]